MMKNQKEEKHECPSAETILAALDRAGFRYTRPRKTIAERLAFLGARGVDFTIEELWHDVRKRHAGLGRMTAFRTVDLLVKLGLIDRMVFADGTERYHIGNGTHQYLTCETCHKVVELDSSLAPGALDALARRYGFVPSGHRVEIFGRCPDCQKV